MLLLIDAFSTLYASYHALAGQLQGATPGQAALYGFFQTLLSRLRACPQYSYAFLCFDQGSSFRYQVYPDYKAQRSEFKSEKERLEKEAVRNGITEALIQLRQLQPLMPWYHVERPNTEGDDLIAKLCAVYPHVPKQIVTGDKDMFQLINLYTSVFRRGKNVLVERNNFQEHVSIKITRTVNKQATKEEKFFRSPDHFFLFRLLTGDTSDNIPGIPGIGDVTGYGIVNVLYDKFNGKVATLLDQPEKVLALAVKRNATKLAQTIRSEGKQILERNMTLMSLVEAAGHINDIDQHIYVGNWQQGKQTFLNWLHSNGFPSLLESLPAFDEMAHKQTTTYN